MSSKSALLVIDMQMALVSGAHDEARILAAINTAIHSARNAGSQTGDPVLEKEASDAFYRTRLEDELREIIDHHNAVLPNLAHPRSSLSVVAAAEAVF